MRAKFKTDFIKTYNENCKEVQLSAVYSGGKNSEDNQFSIATLNGQISITISNPNAVNFLQVGKKYYVDFTEAPE